MNTVNLTLKNFKHAEFASEETECFEATVYVDGKRFCTASNEGRGGPNNYHGLKSHWPDTEEVRAIGRRSGYKVFDTRAEVDAYNKKHGLTHDDLSWDEWSEAFDAGRIAITAEDAFDRLVDEAVNAALRIKDAKKAFRTVAGRYVIAVSRTPDGTYMTWTVRTKIAELKKSGAYQRTVDNMQKKKPEAVFFYTAEDLAADMAITRN